jgi:hypothetical protein
MARATSRNSTTSASWIDELQASKNYKPPMYEKSEMIQIPAATNYKYDPNPPATNYKGKPIPPATNLSGFQ